MARGMFGLRCVGLVFLFLRVAQALAAITSKYPPEQSCRVLPDDSLWPHAESWEKLNNTISGRLIAIVPLGHVCHDPTYNQTACAALQAGWSLPQVQ